MVRRGSEPDLGFHILDIPHHILFDIMLKLPAVTLIRCSSVCSRFKSIVSDTSFQQSYFSKAPISFVVLSDHNSLTCIDSSSTQIQSVPNSCHGSSCMAMQLQPSYSSDSKRSKNTTTTATPTRTPIHLANQRSVNRRTRFVTFHINRRMNLINSSNGLLCLRASNYHSRSLYYVCNPLLGEVLPVPPALSAADENLRFSAFGFDPKKKNFKIIQLVLKSEQMVAEMYQSDSRVSTWTVIPNAPSAKPKSKNCSFDPSFNGAIHWVTEDTGSELICSFDLNSNTFGSVPPPSHFDEDYVSKISGISVGVLKGCLCLCYVIEGAKFETWLMEDYGAKESWRKAFSIDIKSYCGLSPQDKHRPIGFNNCGDMWLRADSDSHSHSQCLVSFCPETGVFRHIDIGGVASNVQATPQVLSYVSIKEMVDIRHRQLQLQSLKPGKNYHPLGFNMLLMGNFR
ncbi:F-box/kelch-repeat protein At3g06240-like [Vicia villosa]|uniref:F-box/kelch-repeat protein At3g06240-like n=1 Tax=Vicia villosa TaxID=3911 RepID=UPI00273CB515|nr:F-box/kelch-repeat protein At3g06240-like [Vicia villosa]